MSDDRYDGPRRENIMSQRLRKARGEEVEDTLAEDSEEYVERRGMRDDDGDYRYAGRPTSGGGGRTGGGCAQAVLYLVLGGLVALLITGFFLDRTFGGIGRLFGGIGPNIQQVLITPTPTIITGAAVVEQIQQLSRLETSRYTLEQVIEVRQDSNIPVVGNILAGDALLLIAHGNVIAGVDLTRMTVDDVVVSPDGKTITVQLPPAEVFSSALDSQKTRVYTRDRGVFAPDNKDLETRARQEAEQSILRAACEGGIMQEATANGEDAMRQLLGLLEFEQIIIQSASPVIPPICQNSPLPVPAP